MVCLWCARLVYYTPDACAVPVRILCTSHAAACMLIVHHYYNIQLIPHNYYIQECQLVPGVSFKGAAASRLGRMPRTHSTGGSFEPYDVAYSHAFCVYAWVVSGGVARATAAATEHISCRPCMMRYTITFCVRVLCVQHRV